MRLETKAQIAKATLILLVIVAVLFFLGGFVIVLCAGLGVNPFRETTTSFLVSAFIGLIGAATILVLLNVATNISLIADAKIAELKVEPRPGVLKKWIMVSVAAGILLAGFIFAGTYISKERYLKVVRSQSEEVLKANNSLVEEISRLLASGKPEDYTRINEIRFFLQSQRAGLPQLTVIMGETLAAKSLCTLFPVIFTMTEIPNTLRPISPAPRIWIATI